MEVRRENRRANYREKGPARYDVPCFTSVGSRPIEPYKAMISAALFCRGWLLLSKLKALLRKAAERTVERLWTAIGEILTEFTPTQCATFFAKAGYDPD
jgi:hypothetical protein